MRWLMPMMMTLFSLSIAGCSNEWQSKKTLDFICRGKEFNIVVKGSQRVFFLKRKWEVFIEKKENVHNVKKIFEMKGDWIKFAWTSNNSIICEYDINSKVIMKKEDLSINEKRINIVYKQYRASKKYMGDYGCGQYDAEDGKIMLWYD